MIHTHNIIWMLHINELVREYWNWHSVVPHGFLLYFPYSFLSQDSQLPSFGLFLVIPALLLPRVDHICCLGRDLAAHGLLSQSPLLAREPTPHTSLPCSSLCGVIKSFPSLWCNLCFFPYPPVDFHVTSRHFCWNWPAGSRTIEMEGKKGWWWANRWQLPSKKCHLSSESYAKNDQILLPCESDGCRFETEPPGTPLHYKAYSKVSFLFKTTQPEGAPQTFSLWEATEEKLEFHSILPYKSKDQICLLNLIL